MTYDAKNAKQIKQGLPSDEIFEGVIINIQDGKIKDFFKSAIKEDWENKNDLAIELTIQLKHEDKTFEVKQPFSYFEDEKGNTVYGSSSNLGKYNKKYDKLPEVGDKVKIITNEKGFGKIKLD